MPELLLCLSQGENVNSYQFKMTGINVYSFEEAVYHCYHYWKQSVDDFTSEEFEEWVREVLSLSFLASKIKGLNKLDSLSEKLTTFLTLVDYLDVEQISILKAELVEWEARLEWEKYKERGDYLMEKKEPARAFAFYRKALAFGENVRVLNNIAIALMQLERFKEAIDYLGRAVNIEPNNVQIVLNLAECCIYAHEFESAESCLHHAEELDENNPDVQYLYGELNIESDKTRNSIEYFERAFEMNNEPKYIYRIAEVYVKLRQFDRALECLTKVKTKDNSFLVQQSKIYAASNNVPAAVKCIERALIFERDNAELWTMLAKYSRMEYDITKAQSSITRALNIAPESETAQLENARIKKAQGKIKDYQTTLHDILEGFKKKYRELTQME